MLDLSTDAVTCLQTRKHAIHRRILYLLLKVTLFFLEPPINMVGRDSSIGIATGYGLDGTVIETRWRRDFPRLSRPALGPTQLPSQWVPGLSWGINSVRGVTMTSHRLLVPWSRKSRAIPLPPLSAVRPVQSLSACTKVHFTFT